MSFLKRIVNVRRSEIPLVALMFLYFFIVISEFWILKPIKKDALVVYYNAHPLGSLDGPEVEQIAKVGNMGVAFLAVVVFTILSRKYHRHQLTAIFSGFTIVLLSLFAFTIDSGGDLIVWSFYLFGDLFNTLMVATFFVFLNDSVKPDDANTSFIVVVQQLPGRQIAGLLPAQHDAHGTALELHHTDSGIGCDQRVLVAG